MSRRSTSKAAMGEKVLKIIFEYVKESNKDGRKMNPAMARILQDWKPVEMEDTMQAYAKSIAGPALTWMRFCRSPEMLSVSRVRSDLQELVLRESSNILRKI